MQLWRMENLSFQMTKISIRWAEMSRLSLDIEDEILYGVFKTTHYEYIAVDMMNGRYSVDGNRYSNSELSNKMDK
jgi:hypothetical protein